jgi:hypothetical protein
MIRCGVCIGVANYPKDGRDVRELKSVAEGNTSRVRRYDALRLGEGLITVN